MKDKTFPKFADTKVTERKGVRYFHSFVEDKLQWMFRPNPLDTDFGIDGYIDIIENGNVTGKSLSVQIKTGDSYRKNATASGFKYIGEMRHYNYYSNHLQKVLLVVISSDLKESNWQLFERERVNQHNDGWWIEIPNKNTLSEDARDIWGRIAGEAQDFSAIARKIWASDRYLNVADRVTLRISRRQIQAGDIEALFSWQEKYTKDSDLLLSKRGFMEFEVSGYDVDERELFEISEAKQWIEKSINAGFPWFYWLCSEKVIGYRILYACACSTERELSEDGIIYFKSDPDKSEWWIEINNKNLNVFVEKYGLSPAIEKEMSERAFSAFRKIALGNISCGADQKHKEIHVIQSLDQSAPGGCQLSNMCTHSSW